MRKSPAKVRRDAPLAEKSFYLDEFRAHTLCISARLSDGGELDPLFPVMRDLIANDTRIVLLLGDRTRRPAAKARVGRVLRNGLVTDATAHLFPQRGGRPSLAGLVERLDPVPGAGQLATVWNALRRAPVFVGLVGETRLLDVSQWIAGRLRIHKWVILDPHGGLRAPSGTAISFMDDSMLVEVLRAGGAEWAGLNERRPILEAVRASLRDGVQAVNLCAIDQLATELFTYEGAGTLFTLEDYCRIERLGIDDFEEVERLLQRGEREGFLKERDEGQSAAILLNGFGATIGSHHLAGIAGLLVGPYVRSNAGEIAGLYTMTRFKSEGVGARLLRRVLDEAREAGLRYVFACTTNTNAADFFIRHGFRRVRKSDVPAAKWKGYDRQRLHRVSVLRHDLA
jgi:amino-acid N-acetyltransferase